LPGTRLVLQAAQEPKRSPSCAGWLGFPFSGVVVVRDGDRVGLPRRVMGIGSLLLSRHTTNGDPMLSGRSGESVLVGVVPAAAAGPNSCPGLCVSAVSPEASGFDSEDWAAASPAVCARRWLCESLLICLTRICCFLKIWAKSRTPVPELPMPSCCRWLRRNSCTAETP